MYRCVFFILLLAGATWAGASQGSPILADEAIRQMLSTRVDVQKQATGIVVGVIDSKGPHIISYGTIGLSDERPVNGDTVFDVGSISKVFTALLLADMARQGEVNVDDPAAKYLDAKKVKLPERGGKQITLADLATHTSGLPLRPTNLVSKDPNDKYRGYTVDLMYECLSSFVLTRDIGTKYEYSNLGYGLLGHVLEKRMGATYSELVESRITQPLGMKDTRIDLTPAMKNRMAVGYSNELTPIPSEWHFGALQSAGAFSSTANDLLTFLATFLGYKSSPLLPAMKSMMDVRRPGGMQPSTDIALVWNVYVDGGQEVVWKNGSVGGYRSFIGFDPKARVGVVALANAQTAVGADDIGLHLLDERIPVDLHIPKPHKEIPIRPEILDRYIGRYQFSPTDIMTVTREGNHLVGELLDGQRFEMFAESEHDFFMKIADAQITFESSGKGPAKVAVWHQGGQDQRGERVE
jgi:D-alanyl-D-alanine-carboxypeptidase/D-alanyl-D-alanine-endopeptidase